MEATTISTAALRNQPRLEITRLQNELVDRTAELATGRKADVGVSLGTDTARMVSLRNEAALLDTLMRSNGVAAARLTLTQAALGDIRESASTLLSSLVALPPGDNAASLIELEARSTLDRLSDRLNSSDGSSFLFGGINTSNQPFNRFDNGPQVAIEAAFLARFGVAVGDPGAELITPADMESFLANEFADLFDDPAWGTVWSSASDDVIVSRIALSERVETSVSANEQAIRNVTEGFAMLAALGLEGLADATRESVKDAARTLLGQSVSDLAALQSTLGFAQEAIERADVRLSLARDLIAQTIADAEGADPAEAKVRVDLLTTQLEMSFALTGQIARLSILNYA